MYFLRELTPRTFGGWRRKEARKEGSLVFSGIRHANGELRGSPGDDNFLGVSVGGRKVESTMRIAVDVVVVVVVVDDAMANAFEAPEHHGREVSRHWLVE